jgi:hypothetical protein
VALKKADLKTTLIKTIGGNFEGFLASAGVY